MDPLGPPPLGLAKICVFRGSAIGFALTAPVRANGEVVGATQGPGHFCFHATPGRHTITVEVSDAAPIMLGVTAAQTYFVEHEINVGTDTLQEISPVRAERLSQETDYCVIDAAPDDEPMPALVPVAQGH